MDLLAPLPLNISYGRGIQDTTLYGEPGYQTPPGFLHDNDGTQHAHKGALGAFIFLLGFFSIWNLVCAAFCYPAYVKIFKGQASGVCQLLLTCLIPHVTIGFMAPLAFFGAPQAFIFYWPHAVAILFAAKEASSSKAVFGSAQVGTPSGASYRNGIEPALHAAADPASALRRAYGGQNSKYPERYRLAKEQLHKDVSECPICCTGLCTKPLVCFMNKGNPVTGPRRACGCFVHQECSATGKKFNKCPSCHKHFDTMQRLPQVGEDDDTWFQLLDFRRTGQLTGQEVVYALRAIMPLTIAEAKEKALEICTFQKGHSEKMHVPLTKQMFKDRVPKMVTEYWAAANQGNAVAPTSSVSAQEPRTLEEPPTSSVSAQEPRTLKEPPTSSVSAQEPRTLEERKALMHQWDTDNSGALSCAEVWRGCQNSPWMKDKSEGKEELVYEIFGHLDPYYESGLSEDDFLRPGGFLEQLGQAFQVEGLMTGFGQSSDGVSPVVQTQNFGEPLLPAGNVRHQPISVRHQPISSHQKSKAIANLIYGAAIGCFAALVLVIYSTAE